MIRNPIVIFILVTLLSIMIMIVGEKEMRKKEIFTQELRIIDNPNLNKKKTIGEVEFNTNEQIYLKYMNSEYYHHPYGIKLRQYIKIGDVIYLHIPYYDIPGYDYNVEYIIEYRSSNDYPIKLDLVENLKKNLRDINPSNNCLKDTTDLYLSNQNNLRSKKIIKSLLIANQSNEIEAINTWGFAKYGYNRRTGRGSLYDSSKLVSQDANGVDYFFVKDAFKNDDISRLDLENFYLREGIFIKIDKNNLPSNFNIPVLDTRLYDINVYDECSTTNTPSQIQSEPPSYPPIIQNKDCEIAVIEPTTEEGINREGNPTINTIKQCNTTQQASGDGKSCNEVMRDNKCRTVIKSVLDVDKICKDSIVDLENDLEKSRLQELTSSLEQKIEDVNKKCSPPSDSFRRRRGRNTVRVTRINHDLMQRPCQIISDDSKEVYEDGIKVMIYDKESGQDKTYTGKISKEDLLRRKGCESVSANELLESENYNCFYYYPDEEGNIGEDHQGIFTHYRDIPFHLDRKKEYYKKNETHKYISETTYNRLNTMINQGSDKNLKAVSQQKRDCDLKLSDECKGDANTIVNNIYYFDEDDPYYFYNEGYISECKEKPIPRAIMYDNTSPTEYLPFGRNYRDF